MPGGIIFIFLVFFAFVVAAAIYGHRKERERVAALADFARSREFNFHPEKVRRFDREYPEFDFMRSGSNRYAHNIMTGRWEQFEIMVFDYHYETTSTDSNGNTSTDHHYYNAVFLRPLFPLLPLRIRREHLFDRVGAAFGFDDIDFESAEFSRKFHVSSPDKRWAYDVIHPRTMELLLAHPDYGLETDHERLCIWNSGKLDLEKIPGMFELGKRFLDGIPGFRKTSAV